MHVWGRVYIYIYVYIYRVLVGKPEGNKSLGRPRSRWKDNIKIDPQEVGCGGSG